MVKQCFNNDFWASPVNRGQQTASGPHSSTCIGPAWGLVPGSKAYTVAVHMNVAIDQALLQNAIPHGVSAHTRSQAAHRLLHGTMVDKSLPQEVRGWPQQPPWQPCTRA